MFDWLLIGPLWSARVRLRRLLLRDLRAQYAGSSIGAGWNVLRPLLQIGVYYFAFGVVLDLRLGREASDTGYPLYLLSGLIPWLSFVAAATQGSNSLVAGAALIKKVRLPIEILTVKAVLAPALSYLPFVLLLWLTTGALENPWSLAWLLAWLVLQVWFTFYLVHGFAILTVVVRDIGQAFNVLVGMLIFVSPVLFPISRVPEDFRAILYLNPMTPLVEGYHRIVLEGRAPDPADLVAVLLWLAFAGSIAALLHRRARANLVDWL